MGLTYLKVRTWFDAAWSIRQAYMQVQKCKERNFLVCSDTKNIRDAGSDAWLHSWKPVDNQHVWDGRFGGERGSKNWNQLSTRTWTLVLKRLWFTKQSIYPATDIFCSCRSQQSWLTNIRPTVVALSRWMCGDQRTRKVKKQAISKRFMKIKGFSHRLRGLPDQGNCTAKVNTNRLSNTTKFLNAYSGLNYVKTRITKSAFATGLRVAVKAKISRVLQQPGNRIDRSRPGMHPAVWLEPPIKNGFKIRYATDPELLRPGRNNYCFCNRRRHSIKKEKTEFGYRRRVCFVKQTSSRKQRELLTHDQVRPVMNLVWTLPMPAFSSDISSWMRNNSTEAILFKSAHLQKARIQEQHIDSKAKSALARLKKMNFDALVRQFCRVRQKFKTLPPDATFFMNAFANRFYQRKCLRFCVFINYYRLPARWSVLLYPPPRTWNPCSSFALTTILMFRTYPCFSADSLTNNITKPRIARPCMQIRIFFHRYATRCDPPPGFIRFPTSSGLSPPNSWCIATLPFAQHVVVVLIFFRCNGLTFLFYPSWFHFNPTMTRMEFPIR